MESRLKYIGSGYGRGDGCGYGFGGNFCDGYGDNHGGGQDYEYGYGYGYGSGSGYGDDYGGGYGSGSGCACGDSSGNGKGYGYGYGYGQGEEDGSGYGQDKMRGHNSSSERIEQVEIEGKVRRVEYIDDLPTIIIQRNGDYMRGYIVSTKDFKVKPCYLAIVGNSIAHGDTLHDAVVDATSKEIKKIPVYKKIERFVAFFPTLDTEVSVEDLHAWHGRLTGSCRLGRDEFIRSLPNRKDKYTVHEFISLTINAYGGEIIKQLKQKYYETVDTISH